MKSQGTISLLKQRPSGQNTAGRNTEETTWLRQRQERGEAARGEAEKKGQPQHKALQRFCSLDNTSHYTVT